MTDTFDMPWVRGNILDEAKKLVSDDREADYGSAFESFNSIAELWSHFIRTKYLINIDLTAEDVGMLMVLLKVSRTATTQKFKLDSFIDIAGYAALAAEMGARD